MWVLLTLLACGPESLEAESCDGIGPEECGDYSHCATITGFAPGSEEREDVGCMYTEGDPEELGCPAAETCAHDPEEPDTCWVITSLCIPDGWEVGCSDGSEDGCFVDVES